MYFHRLQFSFTLSYLGVPFNSRCVSVAVCFKLLKSSYLFCCYDLRFTTVKSQTPSVQLQKGLYNSNANILGYQYLYLSKTHFSWLIMLLSFAVLRLLSCHSNFKLNNKLEDFITYAIRIVAHPSLSQNITFISINFFSFYTFPPHFNPFNRCTTLRSPVVYKYILIYPFTVNYTFTVTYSVTSSKTSCIYKLKICQWHLCLLNFLSLFQFHSSYNSCLIPTIYCSVISIIRSKFLRISNIAPYLNLPKAFPMAINTMYSYEVITAMSVNSQLRGEKSARRNRYVFHPSQEDTDR